MYNVTKLDNYTNPEQSKRLQELGLPVYTADCFSRPNGREIGVYQPLSPDSRIDSFIDYANKRTGNVYYIPVWSASQLQRLIMKATGTAMYLHPDNSPMETCMRYAEITDFSKLEEK